MDAKHYDEYYAIALRAHGYSGIYTNKEGRVVEGCALFVRNDRSVWRHWLKSLYQFYAIVSDQTGWRHEFNVKAYAGLATDSHAYPTTRFRISETRDVRMRQIFAKPKGHEKLLPMLQASPQLSHALQKVSCFLSRRSMSPVWHYVIDRISGEEFSKSVFTVGFGHSSAR